jgi:hypothetical protein
MKTCIIKQPAGLGDIFFSQKIAKTIIQEKFADIIVWPVIKEYTYLADYLIGDGITYINEEKDFPFKKVYLSGTPNMINTPELFYVPLQSSDSVIRGLLPMMAKYKFVSMDLNGWEKHLQFKRNYGREKNLEIYLNPVEPFVLINHHFGSKNYRYLNNKRDFTHLTNSIIMDYLGFDNIFDWIGLVEKAKEIHTVDTVWCYLLYNMGIKNVTVYSRDPNNQNFFNYAKELFDKDWTYIL